MVIVWEYGRKCNFIEFSTIMDLPTAIFTIF
jgi:hypothetical protein